VERPASVVGRWACSVTGAASAVRTATAVSVPAVETELSRGIRSWAMSCADADTTLVPDGKLGVTPHENCEATERRERMPSFAKMFST